jgi:glutamyl-tRNA synthetase
VVKSGARFNPDKAKWFNEQHLRSQSIGQLAEALHASRPDGIEWGLDTCQTVIELMIERVSFLNEIWSHAWLWERPATFDGKLVRKRWKEDTGALITGLMERLDALESFDSNSIESAFKAFLEEKEVGFGAVLLPFRILLTGEGGGPSMFDFAAFIGKEETQERVTAGMLLIQAMKEA